MVPVVFLILALGRKRIAAPLGAAVVAACVVFFVLNAVTSTSSVGSFDRYRSIAPDRVLSTAYDYRRDDIAVVPEYIAEHPFGAGLGSVGPAAGQPGAPPDRGLNAEGQINLLVIELGVAGTLAFLAFFASLLALAVSRLPGVSDRRTRMLLAAVAAPLFGLVIWALGGVMTTLSPLSPYLWFSAGVLAYWLGHGARNQHRVGTEGVRTA